MKMVISGKDHNGKYFENEVKYCRLESMLLVRPKHKINEDGSCKE